MNNERSTIVYIPNKGAHDFSDAERFGKLVFLTHGTIKRYSTNTIYRVFIDGMKDADRDDLLLISSLAILNAIASAILARRFGRVNYLLFCDGRYLKRVVDIDALLDNGGQDAT